MITVTNAMRSALVLSLAFAGATATVQAAPVAYGSDLNLVGQSTCDTNSCTFGNAIVASGTGSFSGFHFNDPATFYPLIYDPFTEQEVYFATNSLGQTASFRATSQLSKSMENVAGLPSFTIRDAGILRLTGYDDTPGWFLFTANQDGSAEGSFSATQGVAPGVPEPASWILMIAGFGVVGFAMRRRQRITTGVCVAA